MWPGIGLPLRLDGTCFAALFCIGLPLGSVWFCPDAPLRDAMFGDAAVRGFVPSRAATPLRRVLVRSAAWSCVGLPLGYVRSRYVKCRRLGVSSNAEGCRYASRCYGVPLCGVSAGFAAPSGRAAPRVDSPLGVARSRLESPLCCAALAG